MKKKGLMLRIDGALLKKFKYVCEYEARSMNGQLLLYIRDSVKEFEAKHGAIELQQDGE